MPWIIKKLGKNLYQVRQGATGFISAKGTTKEKAEAQVRLLKERDAKGKPRNKRGAGDAGAG